MRLGFIVEGTNDERVVRIALPSCEVVSTKGTRLDNAIKNRIEFMAKLVDKIYILSDPDRAGDIIADKLQATYGFDRVYLDPKKCRKYIGIGKWKYGVEHAEMDYLEDTLKKLLIS